MKNFIFTKNQHRLIIAVFMTVILTLSIFSGFLTPINVATATETAPEETPAGFATTEKKVYTGYQNLSGALITVSEVNMDIALADGNQGYDVWVMKEGAFAGGLRYADDVWYGTGAVFGGTDGEEVEVSSMTFKVPNSNSWWNLYYSSRVNITYAYNETDGAVREGTVAQNFENSQVFLLPGMNMRGKTAYFLAMTELVPGDNVAFENNTTDKLTNVDGVLVGTGLFADFSEDAPAVTFPDTEDYIISTVAPYSETAVGVIGMIETGTVEMSAGEYLNKIQGENLEDLKYFSTDFGDAASNFEKFIGTELEGALEEYSAAFKFFMTGISGNTMNILTDIVVRADIGNGVEYLNLSLLSNQGNTLFGMACNDIGFIDGNKQTFEYIPFIMEITGLRGMEPSDYIAFPDVKLIFFNKVYTYTASGPGSAPVLTERSVQSINSVYAVPGNYGIVVEKIIDGESESTVYADGATADLSPAPEMVGHTFDGWYYDAEYVSPASAPLIVSDDIKLFAKYSPIEIDVTYIVNGNEQTETFNYGDEFPLDELSAIYGATFTGWFVDEEMTEEYTGGTLTEDITLYAECPVIFYYTKDGEDVELKVYNEEDYLETLELKFDGYTFSGWYIDEEMTETLDLEDEEAFYSQLYGSFEKDAAAALTTSEKIKTFFTTDMPNWFKTDFVEFFETQWKWVVIGVSCAIALALGITGAVTLAKRRR